MRILQMPDVIRYPSMTTSQLRESFLLDDLFQAGTIQNVYVDLDRTVIGSAVPLHQPLALPTYPELRADCFTERREQGVLNIGGLGKVRVDAETYVLDNLDCLYVGRGKHEVVFSSEDANSSGRIVFAELSSPRGISNTVVASCGSRAGLAGHDGDRQCSTDSKAYSSGRCAQLPAGAGLYRDATGKRVEHDAANTTHMRRSEIYLYFNLPAEDRVIHMMGPADETRHLVVANKQVAISPGWSMHAGVGTNSYTFCWGMGGENQVYSDMDAIQIKDIR